MLNRDTAATKTFEIFLKFISTSYFWLRYTSSCPSLIPRTEKRKTTMYFPVGFPGFRGKKFTLVAGLALLATGALFAQSAGQNDVSALQSQMDQMQRQYEQRIQAMEAKMKSLESKAASGSILNARVLTDADAGVDGKGPVGPVLDESFLKSLTRNFSFTAYARVGVGFTDKGGGFVSDFTPDENPDGNRGGGRLGNEPDTYMELTWKQGKLLGDSPDVIDATMTFTPAIIYNTSKATFIGEDDEGSDFALREAYVTMKNVIKSAPEITFWGGQRFYDRYDMHINDYFFLDMSGYGVGVSDIDLGFGKLWIAYLGGLRDDLHDRLDSDVLGPFVNDRPFNDGAFYKHTLDLRLKEIELGPGNITFVAIGQLYNGDNYDYDVDADGIDDLRIKQDNVYGFVTGLIYTLPLANKSFWQISGLVGYGAGSTFGTDASQQADRILPSALEDLAEGEFAVDEDGRVVVSPDANQDAMRIRAQTQLVWNVTNGAEPAPVEPPPTTKESGKGYVPPPPAPPPPSGIGFAVAASVWYEYDDQGFNGISGDSSRNSVGGAIRPVLWLNDWFALQFEGGAQYTDRFRDDPEGDSGYMAKFTFAPTIKPRGGWFSRPEIRVFATYAFWDDDAYSSALDGVIVFRDDGPGGADFQGEDHGWAFGVQTEWFF
jgi:maltoporin